MQTDKVNVLVFTNPRLVFYVDRAAAKFALVSLHLSTCQQIIDGVSDEQFRDLRTTFVVIESTRENHFSFAVQHKNVRSCLAFRALATSWPLSLSSQM